MPRNKKTPRWSAPSIVILPLVCVALSLLAPALHALETEPNWDELEQAIRIELTESFQAPAVDDSITIIRRTGGEKTGRVTDISDLWIEVAGVKYLPKHLTDESCRKVFASHYAAFTSLEKIRAHRKAFHKRREHAIAQQHKVDEEARQAAEAKRQADEARRQAELAAEQRRAQAIAAQTAAQAAARTAAEAEARRVKDRRRKAISDIAPAFVGITALFFLYFAAARIRKRHNITTPPRSSP